VESHAANVALRLLGHELEKFLWKGMKVRIDNHAASSS
jgi:hypothetical protein